MFARLEIFMVYFCHIDPKEEEMDSEKARSAKERFQKFVSFRNKFSVSLALVILVCYYAFVASVGFFPDVLGYRLGPSSITLGILLGVSIIVLSFVSTGIYTLFANKYFDKEQAEVLEELEKSGILETLKKEGIK